MISRPSTQPSVCCIVLTFNRLPVLKRCLNQLQAQTRMPEVIHIIDNGSTDGTGQFLIEASRMSSSILVTSFAENLGPAGGYAFGLGWATEKHFSYCWVMDDDVFPNPDCLERLLQEMGNENDRIVFPWIIDEEKRAANYPAWAGVLIPSSVVNLAGLPRQDLFWWIEDTEYLQWRLPKIYGIRSIISSAAKVNHGVDDGKEKPPWKYYYEVRNTIYYRFYIQKGKPFRRIRRTVLSVGKPLLRAVLLENKKWKKVQFILLGIGHGIRGRLGKRVDPAAN